MYVYVRSAKNSTLLYLEPKQLDILKQAHPDFEKKYLSFQNNILKQKKSYPLDYIVDMPKEYAVMMAGRGRVKSEDALKRENIMKNFVMRRLIEIRI